MKLLLSLLLLSASALCGCCPAGEASGREPTPPSPGQEEQAVLTLWVNGTALEVDWEENETVAQLLACAERSPIQVSTSLYGGFEQVDQLPQRFSASDVLMTTQPGDIVLYSGDQLVVFFGTNSWRYTKLGHIALPAQQLTELLSGSTADLELRAAKP